MGLKIFTVFVIIKVLIECSYGRPSLERTLYKSLKRCECRSKSNSQNFTMRDAGLLRSRECCSEFGPAAEYSVYSHRRVCQFGGNSGQKYLMQLEFARCCSKEDPLYRTKFFMECPFSNLLSSSSSTSSSSSGKRYEASCRCRIKNQKQGLSDIATKQTQKCCVTPNTREFNDYKDQICLMAGHPRYIEDILRNTFTFCCANDKFGYVCDENLDYD